MKLIAKVLIIIIVGIAIMNLFDFRKFIYVESMDGAKVIEQVKK